MAADRQQLPILKGPPTASRREILPSDPFLQCATVLHPELAEHLDDAGKHARPWQVAYVHSAAHHGMAAGWSSSSLPMRRSGSGWFVLRSNRYILHMLAWQDVHNVLQHVLSRPRVSNCSATGTQVLQGPAVHHASG